MQQRRGRYPQGRCRPATEKDRQAGQWVSIDCKGQNLSSQLGDQQYISCTQPSLRVDSQGIGLLIKELDYARCCIINSTCCRRAIKRAGPQPQGFKRKRNGRSQDRQSSDTLRGMKSKWVLLGSGEQSQLLRACLNHSLWYRVISSAFDELSGKFLCFGSFILDPCKDCLFVKSSVWDYAVKFAQLISCRLILSNIDHYKCCPWIPIVTSSLSILEAMLMQGCPRRRRQSYPSYRS